MAALVTGCGGCVELREEFTCVVAENGQLKNEVACMRVEMG
jgi:hypothetical protein